MEKVYKIRMGAVSFVLSCFSILLLSGVSGQETAETTSPDSPSLEFNVMAWNIWHGGREDGEKVGPQRVVDVIRDCKADLVAMQETYGSGELISQALGFHFQPRGTNVSIHSRFPIVEDLSVFEEFKCVGALVELPDQRKLAFYSIWLPYNKEIWEEGTRNTDQPETMLAACQASCDDLKKIRTLIEQRLSDQKYRDVPVVIAGDFNSMSHLDYLESSVDDYGVAIDWPTSHVLLDEGFHDSWREMHPEVNRELDRTWSPRFPSQQQDRIDYIYYRGDLHAVKSEVIDSHVDSFPSDHAALVTRFHWPQANRTQLRVGSYNIRHGVGMDGQLNLDRTAALIKNLRCDVIGLQEVDELATRSGRIDQPAVLAKQTGMVAAFGSFMPYQGGRYGMAILSRYPIIETREVKLPQGNEPRVALACKIQLPEGEPLMVVNVHFDWVGDDNFRFKQAKVLAKFLADLNVPYLLMGDFNDVRKSRTLKLFSNAGKLAEKPTIDKFTFSSTKPEREIDFIFGGPSNAWEVNFSRVLDAPVTSDHRPVVALLEMLRD